MSEAESGIPTLTRPREGVPEVIDTPTQLAAAVQALAAGTGPVAIDAERAQSFRYSAKSYLFQLRRTGAGTFLIDPVAFEDEQGSSDLGVLAAAIQDAEWIIHAATQDLPCLVADAMRPTTLFDTELAGRLLGLPRVALGLMVERYFGLHLLKEHSAADWSTRPIPEDWRIYAALDVELLIELRELLLADLAAAGKQEWAAQEFAHLAATAGRLPDRPDRWRRTSGCHAVRTGRGLALVREFWQTRDAIARELDKAPGRVLPDVAISELAALITPEQRSVPGIDQLRRIDGFKRREARNQLAHWQEALDRVAALPRSEFPPLRVKSVGPPAPRNWERVAPQAWRRWTLIRPATVELAEQLQVPVENLIAPDQVRALAWSPPAELSATAVDAALAQGEVRPWQRELVVPVLLPLLQTADRPD